MECGSRWGDRTLLHRHRTFHWSWTSRLLRRQRGSRASVWVTSETARCSCDTLLWMVRGATEPECEVVQEPRCWPLGEALLVSTVYPCGSEMLTFGGRIQGAWHKYRGSKWEPGDIAIVIPSLLVHMVQQLSDVLPSFTKQIVFSFLRGLVSSVRSLPYTIIDCIAWQVGVDKRSLLIVNLFVDLCPIYLPLSWLDSYQILY